MLENVAFAAITATRGTPRPPGSGRLQSLHPASAWAGWTRAGARPGEMSPSAHPTANPVRLMAESVRLRDRSDMAPLQSRGWCPRAGLPRLSRRTGTHLPHCLQKPHCHRACAVPVLADVMLSSETAWLAPWSCGGRDSTCPATSGQPFSGRTGTPGVTQVSVSFGVSWPMIFHLPVCT